MHADILAKREAVEALCRAFGVGRLDVFGSAARDVDSDAARSDADFLVEFGPRAYDLAWFENFREALLTLLARPVDLVERRAIEASRNCIRRRHILAEAEEIYAA